MYLYYINKTLQNIYVERHYKLAILQLSGLKKLVEKRNTENLSIQIKIDKFQMENEMLVGTNVNLMNRIKLIENKYETKCVELVIFISLDSNDSCNHYFFLLI